MMGGLWRIGSELSNDSVADVWNAVECRFPSLKPGAALLREIARQLLSHSMVIFGDGKWLSDLNFLRFRSGTNHLGTI